MNSTRPTSARGFGNQITQTPATTKRITSNRTSWLIVASAGVVSAAILGGCAAVVGGAAGAGAGYIAGHEAADDD